MSSDLPVAPTKILILTSAHLCRNPRVLKEATTLGEAGCDVTVLTTSVHPAYDALDADLARGRPFRRELALPGRPGANPALARFAQRAATWLARRLASQTGLQSAHALGPVSTLLRHARKRPAALTIAHTEPALCAAARFLSAGRPVAVDLEDWHSEDLLPEDRRHRPLRLLREAEATALRRAAYVSTTSASLARRLGAEFGTPTPLVIRNVFPLQPRPRTERPAPAPPVRLVWFSQTIGPGRGLEPFLQGWALSTSASQVVLIGQCLDGYSQTLRNLLPPARQRDLTFQPPAKPDDLPDKLAEFDVGLALELPQPPSRDLTITNKALQYLNAGLAVLATPTTGQCELMDAVPGCGRLLPSNDPAALAAQLDAVLGDLGGLAAMQHEARAAAEREFCWEREAPKLLAAVRGAIAPNASLRS